MMQNFEFLSNFQEKKIRKNILKIVKILALVLKRISFLKIRQKIKILHQYFSKSKKVTNRYHNQIITTIISLINILSYFTAKIEGYTPSNGRVIFFSKIHILRYLGLVLVELSHVFRYKTKNRNADFSGCGWNFTLFKNWGKEGGLLQWNKDYPTTGYPTTRVIRHICIGPFTFPTFLMHFNTD